MSYTIHSILLAVCLYKKSTKYSSISKICLSISYRIVVYTTILCIRHYMSYTIQCTRLCLVHIYKKSTKYSSIKNNT